MSIDKDLRQAEGTYCIDMTYEKSPLIFIADNNVGDIWDCPIKSKPKAAKTVGVGFKFCVIRLLLEIMQITTWPKR